MPCRSALQAAPARDLQCFRPVTTLWTPGWRLRHQPLLAAAFGTGKLGILSPPGLEVVMMRPDSFHPEVLAALGWIKTRNGFPASPSIPRIGHSFSGFSSGHVR